MTDKRVVVWKGDRRQYGLTLFDGKVLGFVEEVGGIVTDPAPIEISDREKIIVTELVGALAITNGNLPDWARKN